MSEQPFVSVITLNYNGRDFIKDCLDSVLRSDYPAFEIIILDNASTDNSYELLKKDYGQNPLVKIIRSDNQLYFAGGNNFAERQARGKRLVFLNSDVVVEKNWLKELVNFSEGNPKWLVQPKILFHDRKNVIDNVGGRYVFPGFGFGIGRGQKDIGQYEKPARIDFANGTCFLIDKNFFEKLGGFDNWYRFHYEDVDLNLRAKKQGGESWFCPQSIIFHRGSLTIKKEVKKDELLFQVRKNCLRTIFKNFKGWERMARILTLLSFWFALALRDLLKSERRKAFLTWKSLWAVLNREHNLLIERVRFGELKKEVGDNHFSLLDLGCGEGTFLDIAKEAGNSALGVDSLSSSRSDVIVSSIENLSLEQKFDAVTLFHVLEHSPNPQRTLAIAGSFLKENGVLAIEIPLVGNLTEKFLAKDYFAYQDSSHCQFFSQREFNRLLESAGFKRERKGLTLLIFPLTVLTTAFRQNFLKGLLAIIIFPLLKLLTILGFNEEVIRVYCKKYG